MAGSTYLSLVFLVFSVLLLGLVVDRAPPEPEPVKPVLLIGPQFCEGELAEGDACRGDKDCGVGGRCGVILGEPMCLADCDRLR